MSEFKYLASPFSSPDPLVEWSRYMEARRAVAGLARLRIWAYSPIVHWFEVAREFKLPTDAAFWQDANRAMICSSRGVYVLMLPGWKESVGVNQEVALAETMRLPIRYLDPNNFSLDGVLI